MLQKEIEPFLDEFGLVHPSPPSTHGPSANGIRFTSEYYLTLAALGLFDYKSKEALYNTIKSCELRAGLYARHPQNLAQISHDDYVALAHISKKLLPAFATHILEYGRSHFWIYRTEPNRKLKTYLSAFLGRMPHVVCHFYFCANERPPFVLKLFWCLNIHLSTKATRADQDGWMLSWHMVEAARGKSALCDAFIKKWEERRKEVFPEGLGKCLEEYFGHPHPTATYFVT